MIINVDKINAITPHGEQRTTFTQDIDAELSEGKIEKLFYQIWAHVEDTQLNQWLEQEGYQLIKKPNDWVALAYDAEDIYSVQRLSDGEIFTRGDIHSGSSYINRIIHAFVIIDGKLVIIQSGGHTTLANASKPKKQCTCKIGQQYNNLCCPTHRQY